MSRGLLLVGHGSHLNPDSSAPVRRHAAAINKLNLFDEVRVSFWKEEPNLSRALDPFVSNDVTVVPVFISAGYFTNEVIPRELGLAGPVSDVRGKTVRYTQPIGSHPNLARVIIQRALEAGGAPGDALAVLGHGTPRNPDSERNVYEQAERVKALGPFSEVVTVFLDQEPNMRDVFAMTNAETVVMVPLFVADGWHVGETIPEDLALDGPETRREGRRLRYAAAVGTHHSVVDVILELAANDLPLSNGHRPMQPWRYSLDHAEGLGVGWGMSFWQFRIHRDEEGLIFCPLAHDGVPVVQGEEISLDEVADRCRYDDLGRYRPLSAALTVPTGWYARFRDIEQVERILDDLYPLGPAHHAQWEDEQLRTVPLDEVLGRQTGRYAVVRELSHDGREAARWALCDACCDRVPLWAEGDLGNCELDPYAPDEFLVMDGDVPCPEACSVFVSLCREAALWEKERPDPAPVDETVPFAAFDMPGNEIREKYLALRFGSSFSGNG